MKSNQSLNKSYYAIWTEISLGRICLLSISWAEENKSSHWMKISFNLQCFLSNLQIYRLQAALSLLLLCTIVNWMIHILYIYDIHYLKRIFLWCHKESGKSVAMVTPMLSNVKILIFFSGWIICVLPMLWIICQVYIPGKQRAIENLNFYSKCKLIYVYHCLID